MRHLAKDNLGQRLCLVVLFAIVLVQGAAGQSPQPITPSLTELSCAAFTPTTSEADLVGRYGRANVTRDSVVGFDDGSQPGTVLFANQADARAQVFWHDPDTRLRPSAITVHATATRWRTTNGIASGLALLQLERMNRKPFRMSGFWREGGIGGMVIAWQGGSLELAETPGCKLHVQLQPSYDASADVTLTRQVQSGPSYSSGHPALQRINPRVVSMSLWFR